MRSRTLIAHLGGEYRRTSPDPVRIAELREQIRVARLTEWAEHQLAASPPLSQATRDKIAAMFQGGGARVPS
jgi:hypothetical protein